MAALRPLLKAEATADTILSIRRVPSLTNAQKLEENLRAAYRERGRRFW